jgi:hypothetical protein
MRMDLFTHRACSRWCAGNRARAVAFALERLDFADTAMIFLMVALMTEYCTSASRCRSGAGAVDAPGRPGDD